MVAPELITLPGFADPFSSLSHLIGAGTFAVLAVPLVRKGIIARRAEGDGPGRARVPSLIIFSAAAVLLLSMSGVFHLLGPGGPAREIFKRLDHAAIFVLIAGTFTPIHAILFRGPWRWGMLAFIWTVALLGVTLKSIYFAATSQSVGLVLYVCMGWIGLLSMGAIWRRYGAAILWPLVMGGIVYTVGAAVEWAEPPPIIAGVIRAHEVFHIAVLFGLALHWQFIWSIANRHISDARVEGPLAVPAV